MSTCRIVDFAIPVDHRENQREGQKEYKILRPCSRTKKAMEDEIEGDIKCNGCTWKSPERGLEE